MTDLPISAQRRAAQSQAQSDSGLRETNESTMVAAHKAGMTYWTRNKPRDTNRDDLETLARSCGWHGADCEAWVAGFYGARSRDVTCVYNYFQVKLGAYPEDETLRDLPLDSGCGADCRAAIDAAHEFKLCTDHAASWIAEQVIAACDETITIFWRG